MKSNYHVWTLVSGLAFLLTACGGGGSTGTTNGATPSGNNTVVSTNATSGVISAFGSVFVSGHEFSMVGASVIDDDTGNTSNSTTGLEVGEVVDVIPTGDSTNDHPIARELHTHPLARGYVDASDATAATVSVMGQTVQITSATIFSDHRACVSATSTPCTAISDQAGLTATTGSGTSAVAGSYVTVHGYLFDTSTAAGAANIVATLVSVSDVPANTMAGAQFKAEGVVTATGSSAVTIGGLNVDLSKATCKIAGVKTSCDSAFTTGEVVSAYAAAAPSLPATNFMADGARRSAKLPVDVADTSVEIEGAVSSVTASPAAFVVRGVTIDASALPAGTSLPVVGDIVEVIGTVGSDGQSITATSIKVLHAANSASYTLEGDETGVVAVTAGSEYTLTVLGQAVTVNAATWLADRSTATMNKQDPASNPFNITNFDSYLMSSASQHVIVKAQTDASGNLIAMSVTIVPVSTTSGVMGNVDATPAPVNSLTTGTPTTFAVHGIAVSADPLAVLQVNGKPATVAAGDRVSVRGTLSAGALTVTATPGRNNVVIDFGVSKRNGHGMF